MDVHALGALALTPELWLSDWVPPDKLALYIIFYRSSNWKFYQWRAGEQSWTDRSRGLLVYGSFGHRRRSLVLHLLQSSKC